MPPSSLMQATGPMLPMPPMPPMFANGGGKFMCFPFFLYSFLLLQQQQQLLVLLCRCCCTKSLPICVQSISEIAKWRNWKIYCLPHHFATCIPKIILKMQSFRMPWNENKTNNVNIHFVTHTQQYHDGVHEHHVPYTVHSVVGCQMDQFVQGIR